LFSFCDGPADELPLGGSAQCHDRSRLVLAALRQAGSIIAGHLEALLSSDADKVAAELVTVLDTEELADAVNRLERGFGLRVLK